MKFLSPSECSAWLTSEGCCEAPYGRTGWSAASYLQFAIPKTDGAVSRTVDSIRTCLGPPQTCLFQITDWARYADLGNATLSNLESTCSGSPQSSDVRGILFEPSEADEMFECCATVVASGMSAYLYVPGSGTVLLWEGDLVDVWTNGPEPRNRLAHWLRSEQFRITSL